MSMNALPEDERTRSDLVPANNTGVSGDICTETHSAATHNSRCCADLCATVVKASADKYITKMHKLFVLLHLP